MTELFPEFQHYRQRLQSPHETERAGAVRELTVIGPPAARELLLQTLADSSLAVRQLATQGLAQTADTKTNWLGALNQPELLTLLATALTSKEASVRKLAADALGNIRSPGSVAALVEALKDSEQNLWVCYAAARALGEIGNHESVKALLKALRHTADPVKLAAVSALGQLGDERAVAYLQPISRRV